ncbi:MAG: hypothetical protein M3081_04830 [Gemmatimonadota bacterium]|nr:hypothetical protein [Gemmatimonadota bacterium]
MAPTRTFDVHVIVHTHWDREWYHPAGRFRQRLVELVDVLLDAPAAVGESFLLDGQSVVLADYLDVRPERRETIAGALRSGAIEAGPWFVLADELTAGGEALVRNLLAGRRDLESLGAAPPPVLYSPDAFGHPAALPVLAAGFGLSLIVLWRGLGGERWPSSDLFRWRAPDGSTALVYHLPRAGYEFGSSLPASAGAALARWRDARGELAPRATTSLLLLTNGADHHAPQHDLAGALEALRIAAHPDRVTRSSLTRFAGELLDAATVAKLPEIAGELRDSYGYTWTLQGTFGTRAASKRRNAIVERTLVREAEPWSALAKLVRGRSRAPLTRAAWRSLLLSHPHDTLCGCSIDDVARAAALRQADALTQAEGIREDAVLDLIDHDRIVARANTPAWHPIVVVRNRAARARSGVGEVELSVFKSHVPVGPGSAPVSDPPTSLETPALDGGRVPLQRNVEPWQSVHERTESPEGYPDNDLVQRARALAWFPEVAGYATRSLSLDSGPTTGTAPGTVRASGAAMENDRLRVEISAAGAVSILSASDGERIDDALSWDDVGDAGDLYTHSAVPLSERRPTFARATMTQFGPLRATIELAWHVEVAGSAPLELNAALSLDAGAELVRIRAWGDNSARDHRLRIRFAAGIANGAVHADAMFGPIERKPITVSQAAAAIESPPRTAPMHRYLTVSNADRGITLFSDGLAEYEATENGAIAVTILRAVGELSRNDIAERPGHAGWPVPTPGAQSLGPWDASFAIMLHGPRTSDVIDQIERAADDALLPLEATTLRSAFAVYEPSPGIELVGAGLAFSALKESDDGEWVVARCVNLTDGQVRGRWRIGAPISEGRLARLDETAGDALPIVDNEIAFDAAPRAVVTVLVR